MPINTYRGPEPSSLKLGLDTSPFYADPLRNRFNYIFNQGSPNIRLNYPLPWEIVGPTPGEKVHINARPLDLRCDSSSLPRDQLDQLLGIISTGRIDKRSISKMPVLGKDLPASRNLPIIDINGNELMIQGAFLVTQDRATDIYTVQRPRFDTTLTAMREQRGASPTGYFEFDPRTGNLSYHHNDEIYGGISFDSLSQKVDESANARLTYPQKLVSTPEVLAYGGFTDTSIPETAGWLIYRRPYIVTPALAYSIELRLLETQRIDIESADTLSRAVYQLLYALRYAHDKEFRDAEGAKLPESIHLQLHTDNFGISNRDSIPGVPPIYIGDFGSAYTGDNIPAEAKAVDVLHTLMKLCEMVFTNVSEPNEIIDAHRMKVLTSAVAGYVGINDENDFIRLGETIKRRFKLGLQENDNALYAFQVTINDILYDIFNFPPIVPFVKVFDAVDQSSIDSYIAMFMMKKDLTRRIGSIISNGQLPYSSSNLSRVPVQPNPSQMRIEKSMGANKKKTRRGPRGKGPHKR